MKGRQAQGLPAATVGLALILGPLFSLGAALVSPMLKSDEAAQLDVVAQHPTRWYWSTVLLLVGSILLVPALLGIAALVRERAPRLGAVGGGLAALGAVIAVGDVMSQFVTWQMVAKGADHAQMAALLRRTDAVAGVSVVFTVGGLAVLIGVVLLSVGLVRTRVAPAWVAAGLSVGTVMNIAGYGASSNAVVAVSWALLLAAMSSIAFTVLAAGRRAHGPGDVGRAQPAA